MDPWTTVIQIHALTHSHNALLSQEDRAAVSQRRRQDLARGGGAETDSDVTGHTSKMTQKAYTSQFNNRTNSSNCGICKTLQKLD